MKLRYLNLLLLLLLMSCAAYKNLKPKPEISFIENGYIELKNDDEYFELKKEKKYFIMFPAPTADDFYLVLKFNDNALFNSYLTSEFDDGKGTIVKIEDKAPPESGMSVYPIDKSVQNFYWVIDFVRQDMDLVMDYRYVSRWRYSYETQAEEIRRELESNRVNREVFNSLGSGFRFTDFNFTEEIGKVSGRNTMIETLLSKMPDLEAIFPSNILNTSDEAYLDFLNLKQELEDENRFQKQYLNVLRLFQVERGTQANMTGFVDAIPDFIDFFKADAGYPENVVSEARRLLDARLSELPSFYEEQLENKSDAGPTGIQIDKVEELYNTMNHDMPERFRKLASFVRAYDSKARAVSKALDDLENLKNSVENLGKWPSNTYFTGIQEKASRIAFGLPKAGFSGHGKYANYRCVSLLEQSIRSARNRINGMRSQYRQADAVVPEINRYLNQKNYSQAISVIKSNADLTFLKKIYASLDDLSLKAQRTAITSALQQENWRNAETGLRNLYNDRNFLNTGVYLNRKNSLVKTLEDTLLNRVERVTKQRVNTFLESNYATLDNIDALYQNRVFEPVWDITFTSGNRSQLEQRKSALSQRLNNLKHVIFPEKAIDRLYRDFISDINKNGVKKARAIVAHGRQYQGSSTKIKNLVAECDPAASKWVTKAKDYRKLFVLPVTANTNGENEYMFRINLQIPSDATFPLFDVNIKLPKEIAVGSARAQWYEEITLNKKVLKNEGRFTITAPTYKNDYECQITPLQMEKNGDNILEVRFFHPAYKVFEVSVMAQKPIIRKN